MILRNGWMPVIWTATSRVSGMMTGISPWAPVQGFAFLLPAWGIDFVLNPNWDGEAGNWAVTNPPQEYNWGGSYIHAATGTDNVKYAKDIILAMTSNQDNLLKISQDYSDFTNTKSGMAEAAKDDADFSSEFPWRTESVCLLCNR